MTINIDSFISSKIKEKVIDPYVSGIPTTNIKPLDFSKLSTTIGQALTPPSSIPPASKEAIDAVVTDLNKGYPAVGELDTRINLTGVAKANQDKYNEAITKIRDNKIAEQDVTATTTNYLNNFTDDRLYTILPRNSNRRYGGTDGRGDISYIRLITHRDVKDFTNTKNSLETQDFTDLLSNTGYKKFFVTDVQVSYSEKAQIINTFGDGEVTYYFGRQPIIYNISGMIFDAIGQDWFTKLLELYTDTLRGTKLAQNFELAELVLPNLKMKGSIMGMSHQQNSNSDQVIQFNFQFMAKEITPVIISKSLDVSKMQNRLVNFSAGKGGANYSTKASPPKSIATIWGIGGYQSTANNSATISKSNTSGTQTKATSKEASLFTNSLFSPVYGILTTITKVVKESTGSVTKMLSSITDPVNLVLKTITNISDEAVSLVNLIESGVSDIVGIPERTVTNLQTTLKHLKDSAGVISRLPEDVSQIVKRSFQGGRFKPGAAMLSSGSKRVKPKAALLASGTSYSPRTAYRI